jgi:hypothetical protein
MPPRYAYWTILAGGLPTAFRAAEREDLMPTFKRILEKHPDAEMKWFARGRLWESPEAVREDDARRAREPRDRTWRPGGEHRDPRQPFKDEKRAKNAARRKERFERKHARPQGKPRFGASPQGEQRSGARPDRPWRDRPPREKPHGDPLGKRAFSSRPPRKPAGRFADRGRFARNQGTEEPREPARPKGPDREPPPDQTPEPSPPPRPSEPAVPPPGPPERGEPRKTARGFKGGGSVPRNRRRS